MTSSDEGVCGGAGMKEVGGTNACLSLFLGVGAGGGGGSLLSNYINTWAGETHLMTP